MHLSCPEVGLLNTSAIVASTIPLSLGAGLAVRNGVTKNSYSVVFFGDGAIEEGVFHETMNMACLFELPILFVCLDNGLAVDIEPQSRCGYRSIRDLVASYRCKYLEAESPDVFQAYVKAMDAKNLIDETNQPVFFALKIL